MRTISATLILLLCLSSSWAQFGAQPWDPITTNINEVWVDDDAELTAAILASSSTTVINLKPNTYRVSNVTIPTGLEFVGSEAFGFHVVWTGSDTLLTLYGTDSTVFENIEFLGNSTNGVLIDVGAGKPIFRNCVIACSIFDFGTDSAWVYDSHLYPLKKDSWTVSSYTQLYNSIIGQDTPMRAATAGWDSVGGFVVGASGVVAAYYSTFMQKADTSIECNADGKTLLHHCRIINDHYASLCTGGSGVSGAYWTYFETGTQAVPAVVCYDSTSLVLENCEIRTTYAAFNGAALSLISGDVSSQITNYIRDCSIQGNIRVDSSRSFPLVVYANAKPAIAEFQGMNIRGGPTLTNIPVTTLGGADSYSFGYMLGVPFKNIIPFSDSFEAASTEDTIAIPCAPTGTIAIAICGGAEAAPISLVKILNTKSTDCDCLVFHCDSVGYTYYGIAIIP